MIWWADVGFFGPGGAFQTLDWLVHATETLLHESGGAFQTLDALVEATDALVVGRDPSGRGTLQYKIYPWGRPGVGDERNPMDVFLMGTPGTHTTEKLGETPPRAAFQIWGSPGDLRVREIATAYDLPLHGRTADDLLSRVGRARGEAPHAFTWIRTIGSLQRAD